MSKKYMISFSEVQEAITLPVTKFGGQPVWLTEPTWPLSRESGQPMQFITQIDLAPELFGDIPDRMAYLFMTDSDDGTAETWDPNAGENAVVIQPGSYTGPTAPVPTGPTLYRMASDPGGASRAPVPCEFAVTLEPGDDPDRYDAEDETLQGNKIGGTPWFLQYEEYPSDDQEWKLLLQLDSTEVPFWVNFGDAGIGYAFLSADGKTGRFLWQCM